jgi:agmatinase
VKEKIPFNFGGLPNEYTQYKNSEIVIVPVPFDKTSSWLKGSNKGPDALINASRYLEHYDIETKSEVFKNGVFTGKKIRACNSQAMISKLSRKVAELLNDNKYVVTIGGNHSVSIGAVKGYGAVYDNFGVLHLDAHSDMRDIYEGDKYNHACFARRAKETADDLISVGIRSIDSSEVPYVDNKKTYYAREIQSSNEWIPEVIEHLPDNVYISIDLDVFDPGIMPSTGTPEPGGLNWYQVTGLLKEVFQNKNVIGFDVVELCPSRNRAPDFMAAKLIYKMLSYRFSR